MEHITDEIVERYAAGKTTTAETLGAQTHLGGCELCREKLARMISAEKAWAAVRNSFAFADFADAPEHLAYEQLEFFVDNKADAVEREIALSHLAVCGECKQDLADLQTYREIAAAPAPVNSTLGEKTDRSFWSRIFLFASSGSLVPVAAGLLIAVLLGAWWLFHQKSSESARTEAKQNTAPPNINQTNNQIVQKPGPDNSPEPAISPSPREIVPDGETLYALNDGAIKVDKKGNIQGAESLSPSTRNLIRQSWQSGKVSVADNPLGGGGGVLMGASNADQGVPFALQTPIGKVIRENQPFLQWQPLPGAQSYSVAIVDDKFRVAAESGKINSTSWKPSKPLPRGANYSWQVTAIKADGTETVSPSAPAPQARFRVIEQIFFDDINRLEKSAARSHLALGVLYAKAGLKREARAEFEKLVKANPDSETARKLLQSVR